MESILILLQDSQKRENEYYAILRADKGSLTPAEKEEIVADINRESANRRNYYDAIQQAAAMSSEYSDNIDSATETQLETLQLLEDQLDASKGLLNSISDEKLNQMKMIQINTYFGKQYQAYTGLAIVVFIFLLSLLIPYAVQTYLHMPDMAHVLSKIIWWVGGIYIFYRIVDIVLRRADNYDEYEWPFAPRTDLELKTANNSSNIIDISGVDIPSLCLGEYCCGPGTTWEDQAGCVVKS